jgi:hypothetical protein
MHQTFSRITILGALLVAIIAAAACGSSTTTSATAPSVAPKCAVAITTTQEPVPAQGGTGRITVTTGRECAWTTEVQAQWLTIRSGATGQGDGTVEYAAAANPDPVNRRGSILLNAERAEITQVAGECVITLSGNAASFAPSGGQGRVDVRASSPMCTWSAVSSAEWISIPSGSNGQGSTPVVFNVSPTQGPPRTGTLTIAGQTFSVTQSQGCTFTIAPASHEATAAGGTGTITVTTTAACPWTASSNAEWITVTQGATGSGPGTVAFNVAPSASARSSTLVVAGQTFTVTQAGSGPAPPAPPGPPPPSPPAPPPPQPACTFTVAPLTHSVAPAGGNASVNVTAARADCAWTASTTTPWLAIQGASSSSGNGTVTFAAAASTGPTRTGSLTVAGQTVTVTQSQGCSYVITPENESIPATGGTGRVTVAAGTGCAWTAASNDQWLSITSGASGSGAGSVQYSVAATSGPSRSGTMTIAGRTFTVNQGQGCSFTLAPASVNVPAAGSHPEFEVQTASGCAWTAVENSSWLSISSGSSGNGTGRVRFAANANTGPARSSSITAAGRTFTVNQEGGCTYSLSAAGQNVDAAGGGGTVNVATSGGCAWDATSQAPWLTITAGTSGSGNGSVAFSAAANAGPARSGTLTIGGRTFTVNQGGACSFSIAPDAQSVDSAGGTLTVNVTAPGGCPWTASSGSPWISITSGASGSGPGQVQLAVAANTGEARAGTATIAGRTLTVNQGSGCSFGVTPAAIATTNAGGPARLDVTTDPGCAWTASSGVPWVTIPGASTGAGNGGVDLVIASNNGPAREGTVTLGGRNILVSQESGCTFVLSAASQAMAAAGGTGVVTVTAGPGCPWTAVSQVPWITVTAGSPGQGDGSVQFTVEPNATGAARSGTIVIAGQTFTVNQE